jgi:hypothetical protein
MNKFFPDLINPKIIFYRSLFFYLLDDSQNYYGNILSCCLSIKTMLKSLSFIPCKERTVRVKPWVIATRFSLPGEEEEFFLNQACVSHARITCNRHPGACIPRARKKS